MQLRSAFESIRAITSNSKSLLMIIWTLECHFWKLILLMVSKKFWASCSKTMSAIGLTDLSSSSEGSEMKDLPHCLDEKCFPNVLISDQGNCDQL